MNKADLLGFEEIPSDSDWTYYLKGSRFAAKLAPAINLIPCSTLLQNGISKLREQIVARIALPDLQPSDILVTNTRHLAAVESSLASVAKALEAISLAAGYEFIAFDLIEAISSLSEITGAVTTDDMLERIFSGFCIGK
jgi:tRNA modification GTPase